MRTLAAVAVAAALALGGCGGSGSAGSGDKPSVVAAFYPYEFLAARIGGDAVSVQGLTKPDTEPHDLELTPRQVAALGDADLVIHQSGFQPAVDEAVEQAGDIRTLDVARLVPMEEHPDENEHASDPSHRSGTATTGEHARADPHIWLDPSRYAVIAKAIGNALAGADPPHAADYRSRADALAGELADLDKEFSSELRLCQRRTIVTAHAAFGYLASRYGLQQIAITGVSPDAEPSAARVAEVSREVERHGVTTVFFERLVSPKAARTLAKDAGVDAALLDPVEGVADPGVDDYFSVMRANLAALRKALACA